MATPQKTVTRIYPIENEVYSLDFILGQLKLQDIPSLHFNHEGFGTVIQHSHCANEELLTIPGFAKTKWRYIRTTREWIPIFEYVEEEPIEKFVTIEMDRSPHNDNMFWVCPLGAQRKQLY